MKKFISSRVGCYMLFAAVYFFIYAFMGFEFTVISALSTIVGEQAFNSKPW